MKKVIRRGEIYYVSLFDTVGSEQRPGRPALVVSNNLNNKHSEVFEVVYLTRQNKVDLPTHVIITDECKCTGSTILCEQITSISKEKFGDYVCRLSDRTMNQVDRSLAISIGIDYLFEDVADKQAVEVKEVAVTAEVNSTEKDLEFAFNHIKQENTTLRSRLTMLEKMYNDLLAKVLK